MTGRDFADLVRYLDPWFLGWLFVLSAVAGAILSAHSRIERKRRQNENMKQYLLNLEADVQTARMVNSWIAAVSSRGGNVRVHGCVLCAHCSRVVSWNARQGVFDCDQCGGLQEGEFRYV